MYIICLYFLSSILNVIANPLERFYGDQPYKEYLKTLCTKNSLILIDNLQLDHLPTQTSKYEVYRYLIKINCTHKHFSNMSVSAIKAHLPTLAYYLHYRKLLLVFEFTNLDISSLDTFNRILSSLQQIFNHCKPCLPVHSLLKMPTKTLKDYAKRSFSNLSKNFQTVLLSSINQSNSAVFIRPIVDGCIFYQGVLQPKEKTEFKRLQVPFKKCNLNGSLLNVSVNEFMPYCGFKKTADGRLLPRYSMEMEFLKVLAKKYHFQFNLIDANQGWGTLVNGTWTGAVGHVYYGKSHFAMCGITRSMKRFEYIDFTRHMHQHGQTFMSRSPRRICSSWFFLNSFSLNTWICLLLVYLSLSFFLYSISRKHLSLEVCLTILYSINLRQSNIKSLFQPSPPSRRIVFASWMITCLILFICYSSRIYSFLTLPAYESAIRTIDDLVKAATEDTHIILMMGGSAFFELFYHAKPGTPVFYPIGQHMNRSRHPMFNSSTMQMPLLESNSKYIIISMRTFLVYNRKYRVKKSLFIGQENISPDSIGMVIEKRSPLLGPFDEIILPFREMGLFGYWLKTAGTPDLYANPDDKEDEITKDDITQFKLQNVASIFQILFWGCTVGSLVLVGEILQLFLNKTLHF